VITAVTLERFKRFDELALPIRRLTVLTGANGVGKTTIIHALLLARQAALNPRRDTVDLNDVDALQLGEATDIIHRQSGGDSISVAVVEDGFESRWILRAPEERSLSAVVSQRPERYSGTLRRRAPAFTYLCAERFGPRDVLRASSAPLETLGIGVHGEFTAQVLASSDRSKVRPGRLVPGQAEGRVRNLLHQTEAWMTAIVRPLQIQADWFPSTSITRLMFKTPGIQSEWTRPPNMGFGVSYALPIVVAALRAPADGLLLIENPEAHLHPAGQSGVGAFLAQVASDGVQIVIETHSDHVLNGIRTAIATGRAPLEGSDVAVHFFRPEVEGGSFVETLEVGETGDVSSWPKGFFDQSQRDLAQLARIKRPKR
jgi:predicted ATPase